MLIITVGAYGQRRLYCSRDNQKHSFQSFERKNYFKGQFVFKFSNEIWSFPDGFHYSTGIIKGFCGGIKFSLDRVSEEYENRR